MVRPRRELRLLGFRVELAKIGAVHVESLSALRQELEILRSGPEPTTPQG